MIIQNKKTMGTKFTPGPWIAEADSETRPDQIVIYSDNGIQPHIAYTPEYSCFSLIALSNARLIAAAPELLEALKNMLQFPKDDLNEWANGKQPITITYVPQHIKDALNAINKALGK